MKFAHLNVIRWTTCYAKWLTTQNQFCDIWITNSSRKFSLRTVKQELLVTGVKHKFCLQKKSERRNESIFWANANFHARPTFPVSFRSNYPSDTLFSLRADSIMISGSIPSFPRPVFFLNATQISRFKSIHTSSEIWIILDEKKGFIFSSLFLFLTF
jgi:hypothetical protein